jgi:hypothetical protein
MYVCPRSTLNQPCPICRFIRQRKQEGGLTEEEEKALQESQPKERQLFNIFDPAEPEKGVQILEMSFHLFGKKLEAELRGTEEDEGSEDVFLFADPLEGRMLRVVVEEVNKGGYTYHDCVSIRFLERKKALPEGIEKKVHDLDKMIKVLSFEELQNIFESDGEAPPQTSETQSEPKPEAEEDETLPTDENEQEEEEQEETPPEEEEPEGDKFEEMDRSELKAYIKKNELGIRVTKGKTEDDLRKEIRELEQEQEPEEEEEEEEEEEDETPPKKEPPKSEKGKSPECPVKGGVLGKDFDKYTECDDCPVWDDCAAKAK